MLPPPRNHSLTLRWLLAVLAFLPLLSGGSVPAQMTTESVIDVAVFYTPAAKTLWRWTTKEQAETAIQLLVTQTNTAYTDSDVNQTINLVAVEEVVGYTQAAQGIDLQRLTHPSDGHMDEVHTIRDRVWADAVILIRSLGGGIALVMTNESTAFATNAFGVSGPTTITFAHELGHLMGLKHDRYEECDSTSCDRGVSADAYGYVNQQAFESDGVFLQRWRTIMSYPDQCEANFSSRDCTTLLRFSNPNQTYQSDPLGVTLTDSNQNSIAVDGPADAARVLNETRDTVAEFRPGRAVKVTFGAGPYSVTEGGTVNVTVQLDAAPGRTLDLPIPLTATSADGAWPGDYTISSVMFSATETVKTVTLSAVNDTRQEDEETLTLGFGVPLPTGVTVGSPATATVTLTDDDTATDAPSVDALLITSDPGVAYAAGEEIEVAVVFSEPVTVTGAPSIELTVGANTRQASCLDAVSEVLTCTYTVVADEKDPDGVSIAATRLELNGGTIQEKDGANRDAVLDHGVVVADSDHSVDGVKPVLETMSGAVVEDDILTLTYDEALEETSVPAADAFAVTAGGDDLLVESVQVSGAVVTLTLASSVTFDQDVTLSYTPGTSPLQDLAGNPAATLSGQAVTNNSSRPVYDTDDDGLIAITTLAQLDAVRHDLDGDGIPTTTGAEAYAAAFSDATRVVCGDGSNGQCEGYELTADLDFLDTNGDGQVDTNDDANGDGQVNAEDNSTYWNAGAGWEPIGIESDEFGTTFEGNDHTIRNLFIKRRTTNNVGLFGWVGRSCVIRHVGLLDGEVTGNNAVGGLIGQSGGQIHTSYATGRVVGSQQVGGLVGYNNPGDIIGSYATGRVVGSQQVGGLVGQSVGRRALDGMSVVIIGGIYTSYATGRVSGDGAVGGLVGEKTSGTITASYWDTRTSGQTSETYGEGKATADLQTPTGYSGIYANWNMDGDGTSDDSWHFGTTSQYPALKGSATWQEFGYQLRAGPGLAVETSMGLVELSWTAVTPHWTTPPDVTYTVYRSASSTPEAIAEDLTQSEYADLAVTSGTTYTYQVVAVVNGGEATWSGLVEATAPNQPPIFDDGNMTTRSVAERTPANRDIGAPVVATDPEDDDLTYSLGGPDAAFFTLTSGSSGGQLQTQAALDYETRDRYAVTVSVRDSKATDHTPDMETDDEILVTITVSNVNEAGRVKLSPSPPREQQALTATLSDLDGLVAASILWEWARSADGNTWTEITAAAASGTAVATYTPQAVDVGHYVRATASYTDGHGMGQAESATTPAQVQAPLRISLDLRLVGAGGPTADAGRPEVFHNGEWGTVCDDRFDDRFDDASTPSPASVANSAPAFACQLLGYATGELVARDAIANMSVAPASQPIWLDDVRCAAGSTHWTGTPPTQLHHCYHAGWGLHNCTHDEDVHLACLGTAEQTEPPAPGDPLTAAFEALPTHHDGASAFTFRIAFSDAVDITRRAMKDHALTVSGGTVTKAKRVDGRSDLWEFTVEPAGSGPVSIRLPQGRSCSEPGGVCTADGRMLATGLGRSVPGPAPQEQPALAPLTARFVSVPTAHDGASAFWLELSFDAAVEQGSRQHIQALLSAIAGTVAKVRRKDGQRDQWRIQVTPASADAVTVSLAASPACGATGAVCTPDGRTFTTAIAVTLPGPAPASQGQPAVVTLTARVVSGPPPLEPVGALENPGPASFQSGIGLLSGWVCDAAVVELEINGGPRLAAAYGTDRADTVPRCGDRNNGFGLLFNWNLLGDGRHRVRALVDGVEFGRATFTVTTLGEELVTAAVGETVLADFPAPGDRVRLLWQQATQNFVLAPLDGGPPLASPPRPAGGPAGTLENPGPASFQSGIGLLSGWVCDAAEVEIEVEINGVFHRLAAAYGTDRADTAPVCGDTDNGFGLLFNWNLLGDGIHTVRALADGEEFGRAMVTVTTLGVEFLQGTHGETLVADFPSPGEAPA